MDVDSQPKAGPSTSADVHAEVQLPINLFSRDPTHSIPSSTYLIPASWRRFQLSELINKVLSTSTPGAAPVPFEFIVEGELLRTTLDAWVKANRNGDVESTINVEYIRSLLPPKQVGNWSEDDWVSGVSLKMPG
jgi:ribosome biogenesis protein YTM1